MNAYDAAALLADIGAEARKITAPLSCYDITLHLDDGEAICLQVDKPILNIDKRMRRLCRWFAKRRGNRVDYIEARCIATGVCAGHYVVVKPVDYSRWTGALTKVQAS